MQTRAQFQAAFAASLEALSQAEVVTKRELKALSRSLLSALHGMEDQTLQGDIQFINMLLGVLTPINRKTAVLFFVEHAGFHYSTKEECFQKKDAKAYADAKKRSEALLEDPNQNIWTWAEKNVEVERKPFDINKITKVIEKALKETGGDQLAVLHAVLNGGINAEGIILLLDEMTAQREGKEEAKQEAAPL